MMYLSWEKDKCERVEPIFENDDLLSDILSYKDNLSFSGIIKHGNLTA